MKQIVSILGAMVVVLVATLFGIELTDDEIQEAIIADSTVMRVIDGDTVVVYLNGKEERVRLIGIDAPEVHTGGETADCYADASTDQLEDLIVGKQVRLESDPSQDDRDRYDRLLRYIFLDQTHVNLQMVREGYAYEYTYKKPYAYQQSMQSAEKQAQEEGKGVWNTIICPSTEDAF